MTQHERLHAAHTWASLPEHCMSPSGRRLHALCSSILYMHSELSRSRTCQVCGLKWSPDERELASGGNDNQLLIWNAHSTQHVIRYGDHTAAVKAIAWSPHQHGLLASGGGTADRTIRFWNTATSSAISSIDTGARLHALPAAYSLPA